MVGENRRTLTRPRGRSEGVTNAARARVARTGRATDPAFGGVTLASATVVILLWRVTRLALTVLSDAGRALPLPSAIGGQVRAAGWLIRPPANPTLPIRGKK